MGKRGTLTNDSVDPFLLTNLTLSSKKFANGFDVSFSLYNLFNKTYSDPGGSALTENKVEQNGRTFRIKFTYQFGRKQ